MVDSVCYSWTADTDVGCGSLQMVKASMINPERLLELRFKVGNMPPVRHKEKMFSDRGLDETLNSYPAKKIKEKKNKLRKVKIQIEDVTGEDCRVL